MRSHLTDRRGPSSGDCLGTSPTVAEDRCPTNTPNSFPHEPHTPTALRSGTDTILCSTVAEAVEGKLAQQVLLVPTLWLGASAHHLRLGSSLDSRLDTYIATLCDVARSLLDDGYRRLLFLNGHGGNIDPMRVAVRTIQPAYPESVLAAGIYWDVADELIDETLTGDHKFVGHACEFETSMMLHVRPELVENERHDAGELVPDQIDGAFLSRDMRQRTREGFTGRPDLASAEKGKVLFDGIVEKLACLVNELLTTQSEPSISISCLTTNQRHEIPPSFSAKERPSAIPIKTERPTSPAGPTGTPVRTSRSEPLFTSPRRFSRKDIRGTFWPTPTILTRTAGTTSWCWGLLDLFLKITDQGGHHVWRLRNGSPRR